MGGGSGSGGVLFFAPTGAQGEAMSCVQDFPQIMSSSSILKSPVLERAS